MSDRLLDQAQRPAVARPTVRSSLGSETAEVPELNQSARQVGASDGGFELRRVRRLSCDRLSREALASQRHDGTARAYAVAPRWLAAESAGTARGCRVYGVLSGWFKTIHGWVRTSLDVTAGR